MLRHRCSTACSGYVPRQHMENCNLPEASCALSSLVEHSHMLGLHVCCNNQMTNKIMVLADFMDPALAHVQRARRLIADLDSPTLPSAHCPSRITDPHSGLNEDQEAAVERYLSIFWSLCEPAYLLCVLMQLQPDATICTCQVLTKIQIR